MHSTHPTTSTSIVRTHHPSLHRLWWVSLRLTRRRFAATYHCCPRLLDFGVLDGFCVPDRRLRVGLSFSTPPFDAWWEEGGGCCPKRQRQTLREQDGLMRSTTTGPQRGSLHMDSLPGNQPENLFWTRVATYPTPTRHDGKHRDRQESRCNRDEEHNNGHREDGH